MSYHNFYSFTEAAKYIVENFNSFEIIRYNNKCLPYDWEQIKVTGFVGGDYIAYEKISESEVTEYVSEILSNSNLSTPYQIQSVIRAMKDVSVEDQNWYPEKYNACNIFEKNFLHWQEK